MTRRGPSDGPREVGPLDVLVVGSGVAGLSAAVRLAAHPADVRTGVLTKGELSQSATRWAQGGVAAVLGGDEDSTDLHLADTLAAGAGLCDEQAVRVLVDEGPDRVHELIALGAEFDREATGELSLAREGGHSHARVVHAGGAATGAEVERALVAAARASSDVVLERWLAVDLVVRDGRCRGLRAMAPDGAVVELAARHVVLAAGGAGQLFSVTTNPPEATGDGVAMALRAGVPVADVEFVQFHPTALHHPAMPRPLLSEALRGHGAVLRDTTGERFVDELAPRDVVSRAMAARMATLGVDHLWLDATGLERFARRFPTIAASLAAIGLDPASDWLPIAPAAHHLSGGVLTDLWGATSLPGLWAVGETACSGVHGANRLASNSLLEGMVFGARLAERIAGGIDGPSATGALRSMPRDATGGAPAGDEAVIPGCRCASVTLGPGRRRPAAAGRPGPTPDARRLRDRLQQAMTLGAGVIRSERSLEETRRELAAVGSALDRPVDRQGLELANLVTVAAAVLGSASARRESRGAHTRLEYPSPESRWRCRLVHGDAAAATADTAGRLGAAAAAGSP
ncbi:MAG: L-aspartate oxidase [Acidimicrobiales bacterium]